MKKSTKVLLVTLAVAGAAAHAGVRVWSVMYEDDYFRSTRGTNRFTNTLYGVMDPDEDFGWGSVWD